MSSYLQRSLVIGFISVTIPVALLILVASDFSKGAVLTALGACAVAAAFLTWFYWKSLILPASVLQQVVEDIGSGNADQPIPPRAWGELDRLAVAIENLRTDLRDRVAQAESGEAQLRAVLADMVEGVLVVDGSGEIQVANQRLRELADVWGDILGKQYWDVFRRGPLADAFSEAFAATDVFAKEVMMGGAEGRVLQMHATPFTHEGSTQGTVAVLHDITELRRLERIRSDFVANVSHELRTPLTAIRGFAETLRVGELDEEQRSNYLTVIERHSERLSRLIEDLLALSRAEGRTAKVNPQRIDLKRAIEGVTDEMGPQAESRQLELRRDFAGNTEVWADRLVVEQVLVNLLENAVKYTDPGGQIQVRTEEKARSVRLSVVDSGIGIPDEEKTRIFERFYRVDEARGRDVGGTGLGLAIVRHLVQLSEGEISVDSEPGKGSSFHVLLPKEPN